MGLAGVGTPDQTYAVSCYPAASRPLNRNHDQPWTRDRRLNLTQIHNESISETCYTYTTRQGDTLGAIVEHLGLNMRLVSATLCSMHVGVAQKHSFCVGGRGLEKSTCGTPLFTCEILNLNNMPIGQLHVGPVTIIIINPCKPYLSASATAPHPLGRRKAD
jgi:hypothetical protein